MRAGVLYSPTGLVNTQCPYTADFKGDFKSYFITRSKSWQYFLMTHSAFWGKQSPREVLVSVVVD